MKKVDGSKVEQAIRDRVFKQFSEEKAALGKEISGLISNFEKRWNVQLVKTSSVVAPRDPENQNSMPMTHQFMLEFGC